MGNIPTHNCTVTIDGEEITTVKPSSVLDCDRPACKQRADMARRGTSYELDYIESRLAQSQQRLHTVMKDMAMWELVAEAKRRAAT